MHVNIKILIPG